ncbi:hypothetical protein CHUBBYTHOR_110 [Shigella phage ChubbyThor]|nr:hypothetical protein CHUBBYTHOR_110 [Shigella phage ChubbyThor]
MPWRHKSEAITVHLRTLLEKWYFTDNLIQNRRSPTNDSGTSPL